MKRIFLKVAYDGTAYCGFQFQPGDPTVEGELNKALSVLTGEDTEVIGASRTDAGVHAMGNVAVFDTCSTIPAERFAAALNTKLPDDIRVTESREVPDGWHPRKQECRKTYEYHIDNSRTGNPLRRLYTMHFPRRLDVERMREGALCLTGEHDFTSFANPSSQVLKNGGSAVRNIEEIRIDGEPGGEITITVRGNGFLYNMVRIIAGTLLDVGTGRFSPEDMKMMISACDRTKAGITAEAKGLLLKGIDYQEGTE
ncbi:MAG: tRNA pseudouridine(38-40) synthase TruA [Lachnospiraceae bacterium]|nr:tRNA pseudouridine(38-40) synthase TruA [Lachnospiraceae bacterium]